jgi:lauroyl/myristoyl acyltransferase
VRASNVVRAYTAASAALRVLPEPVAAMAAYSTGTAVAQFAHGRRRIVERNLRRTLPGLRGRELRRMVNEVFRSYARYYVESFRLPATPPAVVEGRFTVEGYEHVEAAGRRGVGPILALPHLGGWEWAAFWLALVPKVRVTAVAEALEPPELFEWFTSLRESLGMQIVPLGPGAGASVMRALRDGDVVCLLSDRHIEGAAVEVEFFGERTTLPAGPATLALRTGAALLPTAVYFRGANHHGKVLAPIPAERQGALRDDVRRVTQALAHELEHLIRLAPEQWHLLQPNWPSDRAALGLPDPKNRDSSRPARPIPGSEGVTDGWQ